MASEKKDLLVYDEAFKKVFKAFFEEPKRKVGRPKKRKRGRPAKQDNAAASTAKQTTIPKEIIDLTSKAKKQLDTAMEGTIAAAKRPAKQQRTNWDLTGDNELR